MRSLSIIILDLFFCSIFSFGQNTDSIKLNGLEIPGTYLESKKLIGISEHASSFYNDVDLYESFLGKVIRKEFQAFEKRRDKGTIFYFEFEKNFESQNFLSSLLWGENLKPTEAKPDEFYVKNNILVIWSFKLKSEIKNISMIKVHRILQ